MSHTGKLLSLIQDLRLQPGDKFPSERELAEMFAMSRTALREALIRLETLRIIELRPKSGIYLRADPRERSVDALLLFESTGTAINEAEVRQAAEVRRIVELQGIRLACERRTDDDLKTLWDVLSRCERTLLDGGTIEQLDAEFHLAVLSCTHNQMLVQVANVYFMTSKQWRHVFFLDRAQNEKSHHQHMELFKAIKDRNVDLADKIMSHHLRNARASFDHFFEE